MIARIRALPPRRRALLGVAAGAVLIVAYLGVTFLQVWAASRRDDSRDAEAIIVLGAAQYDGRPSPVLKQRLDHALELYEAGHAPLIVVTGGRQDGDRFTEATTGYNYLRDRGVPDPALRKEVQGTSTYESLAAAARFLHDEGISEVIIISGRAQSKRIDGIASDVGLVAHISPAGGNPSFSSLLRETFAVSAGRIIGYRRLQNWGS